MLAVRLVMVWIATVAVGSDVATFDLEVHGPAWQVESLRATLASDLAGDRLQLAAPHTPADLHVAITVEPRTLRYVLTRAGAPPVRGAIALGSVDRRALAGVLKDELHRLVPHPDAGAGEVDIPPPEPSVGALAALAAFAALLALPLAFARRTRAAPRIVGSLGAIAVATYAIVAQGDRIAEAPGVLFVLGGLAWGTAIAVCVPIALPVLGGLHRVEHRELGQALRAWLALAVQRMVWLAAWFVVLGAVLWLVGDALGIPRVVTVGVIAPVCVLAGRLLWRAAVELLAARLDRELVDTAVADAWHAQVRGYFVGYLRRANLDVDDELLARVRFLPGLDDRVAVYGGGLTHTRIVVGRAMLESALAPYGRPHDYAMPRVSTLHWTQWNSGLVMPTTGDDKLATRADRDPKTSIHLSDDIAHERIALGEPPTLTGVIEPTAFDPRTSYRPDEDPLWLDWDPGEEYDGTDAGDRDFLFGVLVHAIGTAQRHEDRAATFALAWRRWMLPRRSVQVLARATASIRAFAARRTATVADLHAVLGGARHHLAQYLAWQLWRRDDLLTARAYVPQLEHRSRSVVAALDTDPDADQPAIRARLRWLRGFLDPRTPVKVSQRRRLAIAFAVLAAVAVVAAMVVRAALYHSTYEERHDDGRRS